MVAQTPKWGLSVEEPGDPSDMPAATGRMQASVEAALDRVVTQYVAADTQVANTRVAKAGDTMTGALTIRKADEYSQVRLMSNSDGYWVSVDPGAKGMTIAHLTASGAFDKNYMVFYPSGVTETVGNHDFRGECWFYGTPTSAGGADIADTSRALMRLSSGKVVGFTRAAFGLWQALNPSTRRIKQDIGDPGDLSGVLGIDPAQFRYRPEASEDQAVHVGVIAEQVAEVFPQAVVYDTAGKPEGVDHMALIAGLIQTVAQLQDRVAVLEGGVS